NGNEIMTLNTETNLIDTDSNQYERVLGRTLCIIDECVFAGIIYDGPGADIMYAISENMDEKLSNLPQMFGWGNNEDYEVSIENGLEHKNAVTKLIVERVLFQIQYQEFGMLLA
ncbi:MAG: hypothetical protein EZS28_048841, partial [Streblomastix strix]